MGRVGEQDLNDGPMGFLCCESCAISIPIVSSKHDMAMPRLDPHCHVLRPGQPPKRRHQDCRTQKPPDTGKLLLARICEHQSSKAHMYTRDENTRSCSQVSLLAPTSLGFAVPTHTAPTSNRPVPLFSPTRASGPGARPRVPSLLAGSTWRCRHRAGCG